MRWITLTLSILLVSLAAWAQTPQVPPPPQSARQALLEMFFGKSPDHLERHLANVTRKSLQQLDVPGKPGVLSELSMISAGASAAGSKFETFETGPVLLVSERPEDQQKFEIAVDQDNLVGEENQIDLSFRMYRKGRQETLPVIPRLTFLMKTEAGIWKLTEIALSARVPLTDPDFLKGMVKDLKKKQQFSNEAGANWALRRIIAVETKFHAQHPELGYTCSLADLGRVQSEDNPESRGMVVDPELASGKQNGYIFALTGCDRLHFKVAAEPLSSAAGQRAFCADESGEIKSSSDGKATTCLTRGKTMSEAEPASD